MTTLRDLLEEAVLAEPRNHVFSRWYETGSWQVRTYAETLERIRILSEWFGRNGLSPRKTKVALLLPNAPEWLECYMAVVGLAGIVVPIDPKLTAPELRYILDNAEAELLVTDAQHLPLIATLLPTLPMLRRTMVVGRSAHMEKVPCDTLTEVLAQLPAEASLRFWNDPAYCPASEDIAGILYTSGTTGNPKGALLTHGNFVADALGALALIPGVTAQDDFLVVLPLFHAFSFTANFVVALCAHASLGFNRSLRTLAEDLRELRPSVLMTVPLMAEKLHARMMDRVRSSLIARLTHALFPRLVGRRLLTSMGGKLQLILVGGAKCDLRILRDFNRMGLCMSEGYGLTECAPIVSVCPPAHIRIGTIGPAIKGVEVCLAEPNAQGVGELCVRGPIVFRGYYRNNEATQAVFDDDWLKTGDLATIDADGYITICGRMKALIVNREGKNIYPEEVEQAIGRDPAIGEVAVIAYQNQGETGEKVGCIVSPNREWLSKIHLAADVATIEALLRAAVKHQCLSLAAYKHPRKIVISHTPLTLTSTRKVRRCLYAGTLDE
ncbi:MAG: AMP-binding protein [Kiritimatiellia bacterium]